MLDHLALQVRSVEASCAFYLTVFASLGVTELIRRETPQGLVVGLAGPEGFPQLWLGPLLEGDDRPVHLALAAPSRAAVDAVETAAERAGAEILHSARVWPEYHPFYYGVFLRDPDGNNLEAVCHEEP